MTTATPWRMLSACLVALVVVVMAFLACGCLWGVVRDARTGMPVAGVDVGFSCPCYTGTEEPEDPWNPVCIGGGGVGVVNSATTDSNGIYVMDMVPLVSSCPPSTFRAGYMSTQKAGYQSAHYWVAFDYCDNPNASFDDLHSYWEVQNFEVVPSE